MEELKGRKRLNAFSRLMLFSLITILFVTIRIVIDICSFVPQISDGWSHITWVLAAIVLVAFNTAAIIFTFLEYKMADDKHKILITLILIILFFTLATEIIWVVVDIIELSGSNVWENSTNLIGDLRMLTVICIACDLVAIPIDIISTYLISKNIK